MAPLIDLPVEVILDNLLTLLDLPDLAHLACTNKVTIDFLFEGYG